MRKFCFFHFCMVLFVFQCSSQEDKGLIPGTRITGDPLGDVLVFLALSNPPCQFLTIENAGVTFVLREGQTSICSAQLVNGSLQVEKSGKYQVQSFAGKQTLSSSRCNSLSFDFHVKLREGSTDLFSSQNPTPSEISLEMGKQYQILASGLVNPDLYQCQGRPVSSSVTAYRIQFQKL
ncbi:hypothetical protein EHQ96_00950 [Leptospira levettii]|uniref:hypothetical protein n=1 Tax=Leptospira levettii TaxID=2023178 RepID=UPI0010841735|nr:hypothetical protein [Leptospira levettii]TGM28770.1 hypothetical protein EHQ74_05285 [Leptospira levettii]TGM73497.1 hypothetical protein EHQ96_00950 [Leptospira levettii]TGM83503.1 hypothetical protein EHR00_10535 [Leptospira levettii]